MIAYYAKRSPSEEFTKLTSPLDSGVWVDCQNASDSEIDELIGTYNLDANIVYDVRDRHELPRVEFSNGAMYVFFRIPRLAKSGNIVTLPLLCIVTERAFLTLTIGESIPPESVAMTTLPITTEDTHSLLLGVSAGCVAAFEELIQHTSRGITDTSNRLRTHEITNHDFIHFVTVESNLNSYKMNLDGSLVAMRRLHENPHDSLEPESIEALDDISLHIQQLLVAIESLEQSVESIRNAYSTIANNSLNQRMKTLTVFTVLITLPNVIYGMYGMNVVLPYSREPWMYGVIIGFTLVLTLGVYLVAKRLKIF